MKNILFNEIKKWWLGIDSEIRITVTIVTFAWCLFSFVLGSMNSRLESKNGVCEYESVISVINPPYILGCELFGARLRKKER